MGSGSQVFNQVRLSGAEASSLHNDIYQLPVAMPISAGQPTCKALYASMQYTNRDD